jgi:prolipoprotein diacylglyceryltransferase
VLPAPIAVIELAFDPVIAVGDLRVRLETLAVAGAALLALVLAAFVARGTPVDSARPADAPGDAPGEPNHLRADDLLYIAVAAFPGAVIFGRLGYVVVHLDYYRANPAAILDPAQGGLQLSLGVVGGVLTASIVAVLLGASLGRWLHAAVVPLLVALAGGKLAMALGGSGQGQLSDAAWATAYLGPGPWGSLGPALPAHPSQVYEALATLGVLVVVAYVVAFDVFRGRNGGAFLLALALWAAARALVATSWRDPTVAGPLRMDQVISIAIAAGCVVLLVMLGGAATVRARRRRASGPGDAHGRGEGATGEPEWPDPEVRPRI